MRRGSSTERSGHRGYRDVLPCRMATHRSITIDMDARQHDLTLEDLRHLADMFDLVNTGQRIEFSHDPVTIASRLRDLADKMTTYTEVRG